MSMVGGLQTDQLGSPPARLMDVLSVVHPPLEVTMERRTKSRSRANSTLRFVQERSVELKPPAIEDKDAYLAAMRKFLQGEI